MDIDPTDESAIDAAAADILKEHVIREITKHWLVHFHEHGADVSTPEAELKWIANAKGVYKFPSYAELVGPPNFSALRQEYKYLGHKFIGPSPARLAKLGLLGFLEWQGRLIFGEWHWTERRLFGVEGADFWRAVSDENYKPFDRLGLAYKLSTKHHLARIFKSTDDTIIKDATKPFSTLPEYVKRRLFTLESDSPSNGFRSLMGDSIGRCELISPSSCVLASGSYYSLAEKLICDPRPTGTTARLQFKDRNPANCDPKNLRWATGRRMVCTHCNRYTTKDESTNLNEHGKRERVCHNCLRFVASKFS